MSTREALDLVLSKALNDATPEDMLRAFTVIGRRMFPFACIYAPKDGEVQGVIFAVSEASADELFREWVEDRYTDAPAEIADEIAHSEPVENDG